MKKIDYFGLFGRVERQDGVAFRRETCVYTGETTRVDGIKEVQNMKRERIGNIKNTVYSLLAVSMLVGTLIYMLRV